MSKKTCKFTGTATTYTGKPGNDGPYSNPVAFKAVFDAAGTWTIAPSSFSGTAPDSGGAGTNVDKLDVKLAETAHGTSDKATGKASVTIKFAIETEDGAHGTLDLKFATDTHWTVPRGDEVGRKLEGSPLDVDAGAIRIVGTGKLKGKIGPLPISFPAGVLLEGSFEPNPWG